MVKILLLSVSVLLFLSCKDKEANFPITKSYFTFVESEINIYAGEVKEFVVKGKKTRASKKATREIVIMVNDESTAIPDLHVTAPGLILPNTVTPETPMLVYEFPAGSTQEQSISISLIPENITDPVVLVLSLWNDAGFVNDGNHIGKIKIHIHPGNGED